MPSTRTTHAGDADHLGADAVRYGPGLPPEGELKLLGHVEGRRVLLLGCGGPPGASAASGAASTSGVEAPGAVVLAAAGARVIVVDPDADDLAATREMAERAGVRVETHQGPPAELAFVRADTIDLALSVYGLAAVDDLDRVFRQVHRVLRPDRPLVLSLPHPAFAMLDAAGEAPLVHRTWWDPSPALPADATSRPRTPAVLFAALGRANFRVDALLEPPAGESLAGSHWSEAMRWVPPSLILRARKQGY
ncbi:MAG TPA: class I SAM-dependent methyltransferase [Acidimicrobiales bacterium]